VGRFWRSVLVLPEVRFLFSLANGCTPAGPSRAAGQAGVGPAPLRCLRTANELASQVQGTSRARDIANAPQMTRTHEMTNLEPRGQHRTTVQVAGLGLEFAEDYHQRPTGSLSRQQPPKLPRPRSSSRSRDTVPFGMR
jgi:hypothetical protein